MDGPAGAEERHHQVTESQAGGRPQGHGEPEAAGPALGGDRLHRPAAAAVEPPRTSFGSACRRRHGSGPSRPPRHRWPGPRWWRSLRCVRAFAAGAGAGGLGDGAGAEVLVRAEAAFQHLAAEPRHRAVFPGLERRLGARAREGNAGRGGGRRKEHGERPDGAGPAARASDGGQRRGERHGERSVEGRDGKACASNGRLMGPGGGQPGGGIPDLAEGRGADRQARPGGGSGRARPGCGRRRASRHRGLRRSGPGPAPRGPCPGEVAAGRTGRKVVRPTARPQGTAPRDRGGVSGAWGGRYRRRGGSG